MVEKLGDSDSGIRKAAWGMLLKLELFTLIEKQPSALRPHLTKEMVGVLVKVVRTVPRQQGSPHIFDYCNMLMVVNTWLCKVV